MSTPDTEFYVCCFCMKQIRPNNSDPMDIALVSRGLAADVEAGPQGLYYHYICLRERVSPDLPLIGGDDRTDELEFRRHNP